MRNKIYLLLFQLSLMIGCCFSWQLMEGQGATAVSPSVHLPPASYSFSQGSSNTVFTITSPFTLTETETFAAGTGGSTTAATVAYNYGVSGGNTSTFTASGGTIPSPTTLAWGFDFTKFLHADFGNNANNFLSTLLTENLTTGAPYITNLQWGQVSLYGTSTCNYYNTSGTALATAIPISALISVTDGSGNPLKLYRNGNVIYLPVTGTFKVNIQVWMNDNYLSAPMGSSNNGWQPIETANNLLHHNGGTLLVGINPGSNLNNPTSGTPSWFYKLDNNFTLITASPTPGASSTSVTNSGVTVSQTPTSVTNTTSNTNSGLAIAAQKSSAGTDQTVVYSINNTNTAGSSCTGFGIDAAQGVRFMYLSNACVLANGGGYLYSPYAQYGGVLTLDGSTNLSNGYVEMYGQTTIGYYNSSYTWTTCNVRLYASIQFQSGGSNTAAYFQNGYVYVPVKGGTTITATVAIRAYAPDVASPAWINSGLVNTTTWTPAINLFDQLHTNPSDACWGESQMDDQIFRLINLPDITSPNTVSSSTGNVCSAGTTTVNITANGNSGYASYFNWYTASAGGGTNLGNSNPLSVGAGTYYAYMPPASVNTCSNNNISVVVGTTTVALSATPTSESCYGGTTASVSGTASAGTANYQFKLDAGSYVTGTTGAYSFSSLSAGSHTAYTIDANGCTASAAFTVTQPTALSESAGSQVNVLCHGASTGSVVITPSGGTANYSFSKDNGATYPGGPQAGAYTFSGLAAGTYQMVTKDANGCTTAATTVTITQPAAVVSESAGSQVNVLCYGASTGSVVITPSGGTGNYSFSKDNGVTYPGGPQAGAYTFTGLAAGTYQMVTKDANGCTTAATAVTITQPASSVSESAGSQVNVLCSGLSTGSVVITPSGGTANYSFSKDNGSTYPGGPQAGAYTFTGLAAGTYQMVTKDANGCTTAATAVTITQPASMVSESAGSQVNVLCNGASTGSVVITPSGGTANYSFSKDNGSTYPGGPQAGAYTFSGLAAGTYQMVTKDANGCTTAATTVIITQPASAVSESAGSQVNVLCNGASTGSVVITPSGGTANYSFSKDNGVTYPGGPQLGAYTFTGLAAGTYQMVTKDANGCTTAATTVTITQPASVVSESAGSQVNVLCRGASTGSVVITPSGGTGNYSFSKDNGVTYPGGPQAGAYTFTGLAAGTYQIVTKDANGCTTAATTVTITQPAAVVSESAGSQVNVLCNGASTGSVVITPSGGTANYSFSKDNGTTYPGGPQLGAYTFSGLAAGTYQMVTKDANGCTTAATAVTITQPASAVSESAGSQVNVLCNGASTGSVVITPSGGTANYSFSKDNGVTYPGGPQLGAYTFSGLAAGTYQMVTKDANGCTTAATAVTITQPTTLTESAGSQVNVGCYGGSTGSVVITPSGGTANYSFSKDNGVTYPGGPQAGAYTFSGLAAGTYQMVTKDANGCTTTATAVTITQPTAALSESAGSQVNVSCYGGSNGSVIITPANGTANYSFSSDNGVTYPGGPQLGAYTFSGLSAGTYQMVTRDANGCVTSPTAVTITQPSLLTASITPATPTTCISTGIGLTGTPSGGTSPYVTYAWTGAGSGSLSSTTVTNPTFTNGTAASYALTYTVTDTKGCTATVSTSVTVDPAVTIGTVAASSSLTQNICSSTVPAGYFNVTGVSGGSGNFNYTWYQYAAGITTAPTGTNPVQSGWTAVSAGTNYNTSSTSSPSANFVPNGTTSSITYACYVSPVSAPACSGVGQWANGQVQITVSPPTAFETGGNVSICTGPSVTLNATTPITVPVTWQWYASSAANLTAMESTTPPNSSYAISGATGTSLTVASGNLYYIAVATYAGGSGCSPANSNPEYVTVNAQPSITSTTGASVCTSGSANLSVAIAGGVSPSYQWSYSSSNVVNGTPTGISYTSGTANPLAISVSSGTAPSSYTYIVSVTDAGTGCTATPVSTATLVVDAQPTITNLSDVNICTGGTANFTTTASGGISNATGFTWQYNNSGTWMNVTNGTPANVSYSISTVGEVSTMTVSTTSGVGTGTAFPYRVIATFTGSGCASSITSNTANLTPYPQPTITTQPGTTSICQGGTGTFNTVITGGVSPTYQWQYNAGIYHNVVDNSPATGITYSGSGTSDPLNISVGGSVTPGTYIYKLITSYTASGCPTTLPSSTATLQIASNPVVGTQPAATTSICDGTSTSLTIAASGGFGLTYQWQYYNSSTSTWNNVVNGTPAGVTYTGATSVTLGIGTNASTTPPASYQYQCIVSSAGNNCNPATSATGTIVVNTVPAAFTPTVSTNPVCITTTGGGTNIQISSSVSGINYQLQTSGGSNIGSPVSGTGGTINLPTGTIATSSTFKVLATEVSGGCTYTSPATTTVVAVSPDVAFGGLIGTNHFNFGTIGSPTVPTGWTNPNNVSGVHWITNTANPALSTSYSYYNSSGGTSAASTGAYIQTPTYATSNARVDLVTNAISTVGYSNVSIQWGVQVSPDYTGTDSLYYSLDGGSTWSNAVMFTDAQTNVTGSPWSLVNNTVQVKLPSACDNQANLALKWSANAATDGSYYSMNDIGIYGLGKITNCAASSVNLKYLNTSCSLSKYSVYSDPSNPWPSATPFVPVTNATLPGSPISINVPATTAAGTYNLKISVNDGAGDSSVAISFPVTQDPPISATASLNNCSCNNSSAIFGNVVVVYASGGNGTYNFNSGAVVDSLVTTIDASGTGYAGTLNHSGVKAVFWSKADGAAHSYSISDGQCGNSATATVQSTVPTSIPFGSATLTPSGLPGAGGGNGISGSFTDSHFADATRTDVNGVALKCLQTADFGNNWVTYQVNHIGVMGDTTNNTAVVEINNRGQNLDSVSVSVYREPLLPEVNNSATHTTACAGYPEYGLERHFLIQSTKSTGTNVFNGTGIGVRLYFSDAEFQDLTYWTMYNAAHATGLSASCAYGDTVTNMNSIYVTKYTGSNEDGSYTNNSPSGLYRLFGKNAVSTGNSALAAIDAPGATLTTGGATNLHYVEMNVKEFSEFWLGGSQSIEALPIQMIYLEAEAMNNDSIQLRWATASEINNQQFNIERSVDGATWSVIGVTPGHGNSVVEQYYVYNDPNVVPGTRYYYRLKQIDNNGDFQYTDIVQAMITAAGTFQIMNFVPNPTLGNTQLTVVTTRAEVIEVSFYDMLGQKVMSASEELVAGNNRLDFDLKRFAAGTYSAVVTSDNQIYTKKLVITH